MPDPAALIGIFSDVGQTPIDPRILTAGMTISLDTLVTVYKDHWRA